MTTQFNCSLLQLQFSVALLVTLYKFTKPLYKGKISITATQGFHYEPFIKESVLSRHLALIKNELIYAIGE